MQVNHFLIANMHFVRFLVFLHLINRCFNFFVSVFWGSKERKKKKKRNTSTQRNKHVLRNWLQNNLANYFVQFMKIFFIESWTTYVYGAFSLLNWYGVFSSLKFHQDLNSRNFWNLNIYIIHSYHVIHNQKLFPDLEVSWYWSF